MKDQQPLHHQSSKELYLRLLKHVKPYSKQFGAAIFFLVIFSLSQASIPAFLKPLLDGTFVDRDPRFLFWAPIGIIMLSTVRGITNFLSQLLFKWVSTKVVFDLRQEMFYNYLSLPTHYYDNHPTGTLISKITYDATRVAGSATNVLITVTRESITVLGLIGYIFYLDWKLSLITFTLFPVVALLVAVMSKRLRKQHRKLQHDYSQMTHVLEESIKGHKVIKIFGGQEYEHKQFSEAANWVRRMQMKTQVTSSASVPVIEVLGSVIIATIVYISAKPGDDALTVGGFMAFLTALVLLIPPIKNLIRVNDPIQKGLAAAESVFAVIDEPAEPDKGQLVPQQLSGAIQFHNASFSYTEKGDSVLDGLDLKIPAGTTLALVGSSGSGKTTIANLIPRFYPLVSGKITIDDTDITDYKLAELRKHISYVSQDITLFNDTIANNIAYGLSGKPDPETVKEAARSAYALDFIEQLPEGFDTLIGENGIRLSGGQRQRIAIARALLKNTPILILDEATSALDTESERYVQAALENLRQGRTTIIIAHRLSTVEKADRILVLDKGKIIESGTHKELLDLDGSYAYLYKSQDT